MKRDRGRNCCVDAETDVEQPFSYKEDTGPVKTTYWVHVFFCVGLSFWRQSLPRIPQEWGWEAIRSDCHQSPDRR